MHRRGSPRSWRFAPSVVCAWAKPGGYGCRILISCAARCMYDRQVQVVNGWRRGHSSAEVRQREDRPHPPGLGQHPLRACAPSRSLVTTPTGGCSPINAARRSTRTRPEYRWNRTRAKAGVSYRLHHLRHFFASGLIAAGCDVVTVQRAMGHSAAIVHAQHVQATYGRRPRTGPARLRPRCSPKHLSPVPSAARGAVSAW